MATKAAHIEGAMSVIKCGQLPCAGVTLAKHVENGGCQPDINGSLMVIKAESEKGLQEFLDMDAYTVAGVWHVANGNIVPFKCG